MANTLLTSIKVNPGLDRKVEELLNRKPLKWGNVPVKTFNQDIELMQTIIIQQQSEIERLSTVYVVLSKDQFNDVHVIVVCEKEDDAKNIVNRRKEKFPDYYCWYQKSEKL